MEGNGYYYNGSASDGPSRNGSGLIVPKIMTVEEALPYSPFSSVVPFNSGTISILYLYSAPANIKADIIPLPSIGLRSSASLYANPQEREEGRQGLESLNSEIKKSRSTSQKLETSLNELKELLRPEGITRLYVLSYPSKLWKFSKT